MSWECKCGNKSDVNFKGIIGHVIIDGCIECHKFKLPSPFELEYKYHGDNSKYFASMLAFKYAKKITKED
ncbi:MAG TPA: hypothetical protein VI489_05025 [Candidatus Brocadiaceae bacterium]